MVFLFEEEYSDISTHYQNGCSNMSVHICSTRAEYVGYLFFYTPIIITGVILNLLNLLVFNHTPAKSSTLTFLLVLAIFDFLFLLFCLPMGPIRCIPPVATWEVWARGIYEIYIYLPLANFAGTVSVWTTVVLSVDRYIQVRQSKKAKRCHNLTVRRQCLVILMVILSAVAINIPYIFYKNIDEDGNVVDSDFSKTLGFVVYTWIRMVVIKMIPVVIVAVANILLLKVIVYMNRNRKILVVPCSIQAKQHKVQIRVSAMLVSISVVFLLCHVIEPLSHSPLYGAIFGSCEVYSQPHFIQIMVTNTLESISHSANFIFYCIFHKKFQEYLRDILCCKCEENVQRTSQRETTSPQEINIRF